MKNRGHQSSKSQPKNNSNHNPQSVIPTQSAIVIAVVAFTAGAALSWLILHEQQPSSSSPATYLAQPAGPVQGQGGGLPASSASFAPPDVSQLPPPQAALTLGNWNYDRRQWPKAIESYQRAISQGLDNPDVRTDLGNALRFAGQPQQALEQYLIARKQNPQHEFSLCNLATLYSEVLNDPLKAVATWEEYLRLFPNGERASVARQFIVAESKKLP